MDAPVRTESTHLLSKYFRSNLDAKPVVVKDKCHSTTKEERLLEKMNLIQKNWQDNKPIIIQKNFPGCLNGDAYPTKTGVELVSFDGKNIFRILLTNTNNRMLLDVPQASIFPDELFSKSFGCVAATKQYIATNGPKSNAIYLFDNGIIKDGVPVNNFKNSFIVDEGSIQQLHMIENSLFARVLKYKLSDDEFSEWLYVFDVEIPEKKPEIVLIPSTTGQDNFHVGGNFINQLCFGNTHVMGVKKLDACYELFMASLKSLNVKNESPPFCLFEKIDSLSVPRIFAEEDHFIVITKTVDNKFNVYQIDPKDSFKKEVLAENIELFDERFCEQAIFYYLGRLFSAHVNLEYSNGQFFFSSYDLGTRIKKDLGTSFLKQTNLRFNPRFVLTLDTERKVATVNFVGQGSGEISKNTDSGFCEVLNMVTSFEYAQGGSQESPSNSQMLVIKG